MDPEVRETRAREAEAREARARETGVRDPEVRDAEVRDAEVRDAEVRDAEVREATAVRHERARERFGGVNLGAAFFGWLVAVGLTALLTGVLAAIATALNYSGNLTQDDVQRAAGSVTLVIAAVLLVVLLIAYYAGGYVAGRMSRFDGPRQGVAVWVVGLVVTLIAAALGWVAGDQYNVLDRVDVPRIPIPTDDVTLGGIVTGVLVLVGTLLAAILGGGVGRHYHDRVDRVAY
jgi:hypothetical protein